MNDPHAPDSGRACTAPFSITAGRAMNFRGITKHSSVWAAAGLAITAPALAQPVVQPAPPPIDLMPPAAAPTPAPTPVPPPPAPYWPLRDAQALLTAIQGIGSEGLDPKDYEPAKLAAAIAAGEGIALNDIAARLFAWLVEDLRDG